MGANNWPIFKTHLTPPDSFYRLILLPHFRAESRSRSSRDALIYAVLLWEKGLYGRRGPRPGQSRRSRRLRRASQCAAPAPRLHRSSPGTGPSSAQGREQALEAALAALYGTCEPQQLLSATTSALRAGLSRRVRFWRCCGYRGHIRAKQLNSEIRSDPTLASK